MLTFSSVVAIILGCTVAAEGKCWEQRRQLQLCEANAEVQTSTLLAARSTSNTSTQTSLDRSVPALSQQAVCMFVCMCACTRVCLRSWVYGRMHLCGCERRRGSFRTRSIRPGRGTCPRPCMACAATTLARPSNQDANASAKKSGGHTCRCECTRPQTHAYVRAGGRACGCAGVRACGAQGWCIHARKCVHASCTHTNMKRMRTRACACVHARTCTHMHARICAHIRLCTGWSLMSGRRSRSWLGAGLLAASMPFF